MLVKIFIVLYFLMSLISCVKNSQKHSEINQSSPLTKEEQEKFELTIQNLSTITQWKETPPIHTDSLNLNKKLEVQSEISSLCEFEHIEPESLSNDQLPPSTENSRNNIEKSTHLKKDQPESFAFHIAGPRCPIRYSVLIQNNLVDHSQFKQIDSSFGLTYTAISELSKSMDIHSFNINWGSTLNNSLGGFMGPLSGKGLILSQSQGKIKLTLKGFLVHNLSEQPSETILTFFYEDGTIVELKDWQLQKEKNNKSSKMRKCSINSTEISPEQFENYLKNFGLNAFYTFKTRSPNRLNFNPLSSLNLNPDEE